MTNVLKLERQAEPVAFDTFWKPYPRKDARKDAERAWHKLKPAQQAKAIAVLPVHIHTKWATREKEHIPHAATWLNGWRFDDELDAEPDTAARVRSALGG